MAQKTKISAPRGTRDLYPEDVLRRRYITQAWRDVSIRHGFDEIEGPTFEQSELYAVKSGEGILGELFQAFSGKSPEEIEEVKRTGRAPFALRPEFTPTLARMYAAKAASLPTPTKWFTAGPYFRAERPQRGRLREFLQWNCDIMRPKDEDSEAVWSAEALHNAELVLVVSAMLADLGLAESVRIGISERRLVESVLQHHVRDFSDQRDQAFALLDQRLKLGSNFEEEAQRLGFDWQGYDTEIDKVVQDLETASRGFGPAVGSYEGGEEEAVEKLRMHPRQILASTFSLLSESASRDMFVPDVSIARGLAYYTGMVFEVIADGERAVAGGGRYDNLIELFGGPSTPAVGFGMGDVVLSLLLEDKGLMPEGEALMDAVSRPPASVRPDAFVIAEDEALDPVVTRTVARLRAGVESDAWGERGGKPWDVDRYEVPPMHARRSYKATRKRDKLVKDAMKVGAKCVVVVESDEACTVRELGSGREEGVGLEGLGAVIARIAL